MDHLNNFVFIIFKIIQVFVNEYNNYRIHK